MRPRPGQSIKHSDAVAAVKAKDAAAVAAKNARAKAQVAPGPGTASGGAKASPSAKESKEGESSPVNVRRRMPTNNPGITGALHRDAMAAGQEQLASKVQDTFAGKVQQGGADAEEKSEEGGQLGVGKASGLAPLGPPAPLA